MRLLWGFLTELWDESFTTNSNFIRTNWLLTDRDFVARHTACEALLETLPHDAVTFFSDEAHFHLSGCVNKQNMRYWSAENPRQLHQTPLHCQRVTVWCAISSVGIIGPYFFEENERAVAVNAARYREMIEEFFLPHLEEMDVGDVWFQQDGATAHTAWSSMELLRERSPGRLISLRGDLPWPARSPDLAPCDFFLWDYLKSIVYNDRPRTLAHLKTNIWNAIAEIPVDMLQRVARNFRNRLIQYIDNGGRHLTDVISKTAWKKFNEVICKGEKELYCKELSAIVSFLLTFQKSKFLCRTLHMVITTLHTGV